jgi:hypothetical protein
MWNTFFFGKGGRVNLENLEFLKTWGFKIGGTLMVFKID